MGFSLIDYIFMFVVLLSIGWFCFSINPFIGILFLSACLFYRYADKFF
jgi:hypothetical protein